MPGAEELRTLHTALIDARNGYDEAIADAEKPELGATFEKLRRLHARAHEEVHGLLVGLGEHPDESGSFMTTVHEVVIGVRSAILGLDRGSLQSFASGEEYTVQKYDKAMAVSPEARDALGPHKAALQAAIDEMRRVAS